MRKFKVGDIVVTKKGLEKDFLNKKGRIVRIYSSKESYLKSDRCEYEILLSESKKVVSMMAHEIKKVR